MYLYILNNVCGSKFNMSQVDITTVSHLHHPNYTLPAYLELIRIDPSTWSHSF